MFGKFTEGVKNIKLKTSDLPDVCLTLPSAEQSCKRADKFRSEPGPNPKINFKPKSYPKKSESKVRSEKFSNIANLFLLFSCTPNTKSMSQARIKHDIFVNFRPKPGPNPARTRPDLQLRRSMQLNGGSASCVLVAR